MYPYNPVGYDPLMAAQMPDGYNNPLNFGAYGINPGMSGWGVNSAYLTPSFMAGYRPGYMGQQNFPTPQMNFGRALATAIPAPTQPNVPMYADPLRYRQGAYNEVASGVPDALMGVAQIGGSVAVGLAMQGALDSVRIPGGANEHWKALSFHYRRVAPSFLGGVGTNREAMALARSQTMFEAAGHYMGAGLGRAVGHTASGLVRVGSLGIINGVPALGRTLGAVGSFAGAAAGTLALPYMAGSLIMEGFNQAVFSPYVQGAQTANTLRDTLEGTYTGLGLGVSPLNVSGVNSARIGYNVARGVADQTFDQSVAAPMLGYGLQAGLYKNIDFNKDSIVKRTREVAQGVKVMMEVFNDPSIQDAIQRLGQLANTAGVTSIGGISALSNKYRLASAVSGIGTRELMETYGIQGQLMYNQVGLVPFLGQMASMNAITAMSAAQRTGLISSASLAAMGGIGGASQLAMQAQLGLAQSPYNMMSAFNMQALGSGQQGLLGTLGTFGSFMARNPVRGYGEYMLNRRDAMSAQLSKDPGFALNSIFEQARSIPGAFDENGKLSAGAFTSIATAQGLSEDQVRALLTQMRASADPATRSFMNNASRAIDQSRYAAALERQNLTYYGHGFAGIGSLSYNLSDFRYNVQDASSRMIGQPIRESVGRFGDWITETMLGHSNAGSYSAGTDYSNISSTDVTKQLSFSRTSMKFDQDRVRMLSRPRGTDVWDVLGLISKSGLKASSAMRAGPDMASITSNIQKLNDMSGTNPKLKSVLSRSMTGGVLPTGDLATVASALGMTDLDSARDIMAYYGSQQGTTSYDSGSLYDKQVSGARTNLIDAIKSRFSGATGEIGDASQSFAKIKSSLSALTDTELGLLGAFASLNGDALSNDVNFRNSLDSSTKGGAELKAVLMKLGYGGMFGNGENSSTLTNHARQLVLAAAATFSGNGNMKQLGVAASSLLQSGQPLNKANMQKAMSSNWNAVRSTIFGNKDMAAFGKASSSEIINELSSTNSRISNAVNGNSMEKFGGQMDFSGLLEASERQLQAGSLQLEAARLFANATAFGTPGAKETLSKWGLNPDGSLKTTTDSSKFTPLTLPSSAPTPPG